MSFLKNGCDPAKVRHAHLPERSATERAAERLADRPATKARDSEPWEAVLARLDLTAPASLRARDAKRLLRDMWVEHGCEGVERQLLADGEERNRASIDRAIVESYLLRYPISHSAFADLRETSERVAGRRDWPWRARGEDFRLWDEQAGPERLATALLATDHPAEVLRRAGLDGDLATGAFVRQAVRAACLATAAQKGSSAIENGERLVNLAEAIRGAEGIDGLLALGLLAPWIDTSAPPSHQAKVVTILMARYGDPRSGAPRWKELRRQAEQYSQRIDIEAAFSVLRRWLVRKTVERFFNVIAKTTDEPRQWAQRTEFWTGYLQHNLIEDAWFVLGPRAEDMFRVASRDADLHHGRIKAGDGGAGHSALVMKMGALRIAEWSHNGSCRFWPERHPDAPVLGQAVYYRTKLKARYGSDGFANISHSPSHNWQPKFARHIYQATGITHPKHGAGW